MIGQEVRVSVAEIQAHENWRRNLRALGRRQVGTADIVHAAGMPEGVEWVFGRDGALTIRNEDGAWSGGSGLPGEVARRVLSKMGLGATVACFLFPTHAQQIRVSLEKMSPSQALLAVVPDVNELRVILGCENFAKEITAGRLWLVSGENWAGEMKRLFEANEGLPTPGQFVRTHLVDAAGCTEAIAAAERVLRSENERRTKRVAEIFATAPKTSSVAVIAPSRFRLWDDAGAALGKVARAQGWETIDPDDVTCASPVALARIAAGKEALLVANAARFDLPSGIPSSLPIITWLTGGRIPRFDADRGLRDGLIVADAVWRAAAMSAGWPASQVAVGGWGSLLMGAASGQNQSAGRGLAVIADTVAVTLPDFEKSSQRVLWETISTELGSDPFKLGNDAPAYLESWAKRGGVELSAADRALFLDRLIAPLHAQGLVRALLAAGIPLQLFGKGWDQLAELAGVWRGEVSSREELRAAAEGSVALVHIWPGAEGHPVDAVGKPVLRRGALTRDAWIAAAKKLASGTTAEPSPTPEITGGMVRQLIAHDRPESRAA